MDEAMISNAAANMERIADALQIICNYAEPFRRAPAVEREWPSQEWNAS